MARKYTDDELLSALRALADDLGRSPTTGEMDERGMCAANTYKRRFGSWNAALEAAGLDVTRERDIDDVSLLREVARLAGDLGRPPIAAEMAERGRYSPSTYRNRFGSWGTALAEAGYAVRGAAPRRSQNVDHLREHGPSTVADLPGEAVQVTDRMLGAAKFDVDTRSGGVGGAGGLESTPVYYLLDDHDRTAVVRAFLAANPALVERLSPGRVVRLVEGNGRGWTEPAEEALVEFEEE